MRRGAGWAARLVVGVLILVLSGLWFMTQTDWGRNRIRLYGLRQLAERVHGRVTIGEVHGDLLTGATLVDVIIEDSTGAPFLKADTLELRYSMSGLFRKHLVFRDVRVVRPILVFEQPPGGEWNVERLFRGDTTVVRGDTIPGWGDWVRFEGVQVVNGDVTVRRPWSPSESLAGDALDQAIDAALSDRSRLLIERVPNGYQAVSTFHDVFGGFPLIRFADPDSASRIVDVDSLRMRAFVFRPPGADIRQMTGRLVVGADSIGFQDIRVQLPNSKLAVDGVYGFGAAEGGAVRIQGDPIALPDVRFLRPSLPEGGGRADFAVVQSDRGTRLTARTLDLKVESATLKGSLDAETGPAGVRVRGSDLAFAELDTDLVERLAGIPALPIDGVLTGHAKLAGVRDDLTLDAWTDIRERSGAVSRVEAEGGVTGGHRGSVARDLHLRFAPLRLSLLRQTGASVPVGGALTGTATLDGPLASMMNVSADLVHEDASTGRSHVLARGGFKAVGGIEARALRLELEPLQARLVRVVNPEFPVEGTFTGRATVTGAAASWITVDADLVHQQPSTGRSHILAVGDVRGEGGLAARRLRLRFDPLQTRLVRELAPDFPLEGTLSGRATVTGATNSWLTVDADLEHEQGGVGRSHVLAVGDVRGQGGVAARGLRLRLDPVQAAAVRAFLPEFRPDGTLAGTMFVNGSATGALDATSLDLTHVGSTGTSMVTGEAHVATRNGVRSFDLNLLANPLALGTVGLYVPAAGLTGSVTGPVAARGTTKSATFEADVEVAEGGHLTARGTVGIGVDARYDVVADLAAFDAGAISNRAPTTRVTGSITAQGVGTELATARGFVDAALVDSRVEGAPSLDSTRVRAGFANGLLTMERGEVRFGTARADLEGSFGLVAGRSGELRYRVTADSLSAFRRQYRALTQDSSFVLARPMVRAREIGRARLDSARIVDEHMVERVATGGPPAPDVPLDTAPPLRRDSIAGAVAAEGTLVGNLERFDARGTADLDQVVFNGSYVGSGRVAYAVANAPSPEMSAHLDAQLADVRTGGFAFDSARARVDHTGGKSTGSGSLEVAAFQDAGRDYQLAAEYTLSLDQQELRLNDLRARFDSTRWGSTQPGTVRWAGSGVELEHIELRNERGGRIFADGRLPTEGSGDLTLDVDSVQIADFAALIQDTIVTRGLLSFEGTFRGTTRAPLLTGTMALDSAARAGQRLPSLRATFDYANERMTGHAEAFDGGRRLLAADGELPLNLAFTGLQGPRLPDGPVSLDLQADSFPLEALPMVSSEVQNLSGRLRGTVAVRGTRADPELAGQVRVDGVAVDLPTPGLNLRDGRGNLRFAGDEMIVDSLVASSGGGPVTVDGTIRLATLTNPELALNLVADDALLLANDRGEVEADAHLTIGGTLEALRVIGEVEIIGGVIAVPEPQNMQRATRLDDPQLVGIYETLGVPANLRPRNRLLENTELDVAVTIARDTWLRNSVMNVEVYTPDDADALRVTIDHATRQYVFQGVIHADRGDYTFAGRQFKLSAGSVTFLPELADPILQLSARHEVPRRTREALVILVSISGTLKEPKVSLSSNVEPPIAESDLLSFLAFGRESSGLLTDEGSGIAGDALGALGVLAEQQLGGLALGAVTQTFFSNIESEGMKAGLDVFRVRPRAVMDELNFAGYFENLLEVIDVEAGEYLTSNLFVAAHGSFSSSQQRAADGTITRSQRPQLGLRAEYITPRGFSWITTLDNDFLPAQPTLDELIATPIRVFGSFITWSKRF